MTHELTVRSADLIAGLKQIKRSIGLKRKGEAMLSFDGELLEVQLEGAAVGIPATGHWRGKAKFSAFVLQSIQRVPPRDPFKITFENGKVSFGGLRVAAEWYDIAPPALEIAADLDFVELLWLKTRHSPEQLTSSGLMKRVQEAESVAARRVKKALAELGAFGVTEDDIWALVWEKLRE